MSKKPQNDFVIDFSEKQTSKTDILRAHKNTHQVVINFRDDNDKRREILKGRRKLTLLPLCQGRKNRFSLYKFGLANIIANKTSTTAAKQLAESIHFKHEQCVLQLKLSANKLISFATGIAWI